MYRPVEFVYIFETFRSDFMDFYVTKERSLEKQSFFQFSFFYMHRISQNLGEYAIGMLNAGMTMNAVAMNIGCCTRAIPHLRQRFQATGSTEDRPRSGRPLYSEHPAAQ